jgi:hypothetical protein
LTPRKDRALKSTAYDRTYSNVVYDRVSLSYNEIFVWRRFLFVCWTGQVFPRILYNRLFPLFQKGSRTQNIKNFMKTKDIMPATCTSCILRNRSDTFPLIYTLLDRAKLTNGCSQVCEKSDLSLDYLLWIFVCERQLLLRLYLKHIFLYIL